MSMKRLATICFLPQFLYLAVSIAEEESVYLLVFPLCYRLRVKSTRRTRLHNSSVYDTLSVVLHSFRNEDYSRSVSASSVSGNSRVHNDHNRLERLSRATLVSPPRGFTKGAHWHFFVGLRRKRLGENGVVQKAERCRPVWKKQ